MNPAYVLLGLLIALPLLVIWDGAGTQLREQAQAEEDAPPDAPPSVSVVLQGLAVVAIIVGGFFTYLFPQIVINAVLPDEPAPWAGPCLPSVAPASADAGPQERARLSAAAWIHDQLRSQGAPDCAAGPRPLGGLDYTTSGADLGK